MTISFSQTTRLILLFTCLGLIQTTAFGSKITPDDSFEKALVKPRVESMECFVRTRFNADVERHIKGFTVLAKKNAQRILGESMIYFPTIEAKIKELGLPDDLKYLTVVESMLDPKAVSNAGAKGMWQLMPFIAEDYDLRMDDLTDERFHIEKSAEAGLKYLKKLHDRFGNWELALAAYNCGANRVRKTLKQSGKKTYWGIRHLLPRQTREFVPKLVAVKYLFHYYQHHALTPTFPAIDLQFARTIEVDGGMSYEEISEITGVTAGLLAAMNPNYIYNPKHTTQEKIDIVLPSRVANAVQNHKDQISLSTDLNISYTRDSSTTANPYFKVIYNVPNEMDLKQFCDMYNLSRTQIWLWNELTDENLKEGQEIFAYQYHDLVLDYKVNRSKVSDHVYIEPLALEEIRSNKENESKDSEQSKELHNLVIHSEDRSILVGR